MGQQVESERIFGDRSNHPFRLYPNDSKSRVKTIDVWIGPGTGDAEDYIVFKGIQLTWFDGKSDLVYRHPDDDRDKKHSFTFEEGESAVWTVQAGSRIVIFEIETSQGRRWKVGEQTGPIFPDVADGYLIGIEGSSGWEIDNLLLIYETKE